MMFGTKTWGSESREIHFCKIMTIITLTPTLQKSISMTTATAWITLVLLLMPCVTVASSFDEFKKIYNRQYTTSEEALRKQIFNENVRLSDTHNMKEGVTWKKGVTQFSDLTKEEFQKHHTMAGFHNATRNVAAVAAAASVSIDHAADRALLATLPLSVDWTLIGAVTPVKNQGQCGSCWVFAATGSMEGALSIASGKAAVSLSEEEYLACYGKDYTVCNGGDAAQALRWAQNHSICTEASYPYVAPTGKPFPPPPTLVCHASNCSNPANVGVPQGYVTQIHYVTPKSEVALMEAVSIGPVAVSIDAGALSQYRSGVISGQCAGYIGDHAVLVVGYGHDDASGLDYWKVKNSYGIDFGEAGYFRAQRNNTKCGGGTGEMGILESPVYPTIVVK